MNKLINYISRIDKKALFLSIIPLLSILGFINIGFKTLLYYGILIYISIYAINFKERVISISISLLVVFALSIIVGQPDPLFNSWSRLGLFCLLFISVFPVFESKKIDSIRKDTLKYTLIFLSGLSIGSFICYLLGVNYFRYDSELGMMDVNVVGGFGGLIRHSMLLGPTAAVATLFLAYKSFTYLDNRKLFVIYIVLCSISICTVFLSASRGATLGAFVGLISMFYLKYRHRLDKLVSRLLLIVVILIAISPVYEPYLEKVLIKQQINAERGNSINSRSNRWDHRFEEFKSSPVLGVGFSALSINNTEEYMAETGSCEPGTSWFSILSMTGLLGFGIFLLMYIQSLNVLWQMSSSCDIPLLLIPVLMFFGVHMLIEGYVLAAGSYLSFLFWLTFGNAYSYVVNNDSLY